MTNFGYQKAKIEEILDEIGAAGPEKRRAMGYRLP